MGRDRQEYQAQWYEENKARHAEASRRNRAKRKREVIEGYGGCCACCGERELAFLTIDHVNGGGGGTQERRTKAGHTLYTRLRATLPEQLPGYRVLCWNCNAATHFQGVCPHQR